LLDVIADDNELWDRFGAIARCLEPRDDRVSLECQRAAFVALLA
jgi:hypothetical protein